MTASADEPHFPLRVFDPDEDVLATERRLPHWAQAHTLCFITWRTWDSIPGPILRRWLKERWQWLLAHGIDTARPKWRQKIEHLPLSLQTEFHRTFGDRWHEQLDRGHGACVLRKPELAKIVADSLLHFDRERYLLTDFVVMPNHVHLLAAFETEQAMLEQCESWKHYMAVQINRKLQRKGRFWQQDAFDHLVRSVDQFEYLQRYIASNPKAARLKDGQFVHYTKDVE